MKEENQTIIKAINMFGRVPEQYELLEEIERLNKELETLKQPQVFIDTQDMEERYGEELYKEYLEKENKRLNNIINELEKYCNEEIEDYDKHINSKFITDIAREQYEGEKVCFEDMLGKLQELKGSDK